MLSMAVRFQCGLVLTAAVSRREALESILQDIIVLLVADCDILESILDGSVDPVLNNNAAAVCEHPRKTPRVEDSPAYEIRPRLPNGILERACDCEGCAHAQTEAQYATIQLPQTVLQPVSATEALDAGSARRHGRLVGEEAIDDQGVEADDGGGREDDIYAQPGDRDTLLGSEGIVQRIVFERKLLVEGRDLVDEGEDADEDPVSSY